MLTPRQQRELDEAYGHHSVHIFEVQPQLTVRTIGEVPAAIEMVQQVWTYNFDRRAWEYYGVPGSSMPTDYYVPIPTSRIEPGYYPTPNTTGYMQILDEVDNGTTYQTYDQLYQGTYTTTGGRAGGGAGEVVLGRAATAADIGQPLTVDAGTGRLLVGTDFAYTDTVPIETARGFTMRTIRQARGNNYDIVHKAT